MKSKIFWGTVAPLAAILNSLLLVYVILKFRGVDPIEMFKLMASYGFDPRNLVSELNQTVAYYMAQCSQAVYGLQLQVI